MSFISLNAQTMATGQILKVSPLSVSRSVGARVRRGLYASQERPNVAQDLPGGASVGRNIKHSILVPMLVGLYVASDITAIGKWILIPSILCAIGKSKSMIEALGLFCI
jgi:hypothetical protein